MIARAADQTVEVQKTPLVGQWQDTGALPLSRLISPTSGPGGALICVHSCMFIVVVVRERMSYTAFIRRHPQWHK